MARHDTRVPRQPAIILLQSCDYFAVLHRGTTFQKKFLTATGVRVSKDTTTAYGAYSVVAILG
jgi:hypothetical protein